MTITVDSRYLNLSTDSSSFLFCVILVSMIVLCQRHAMSVNLSHALIVLFIAEWPCCEHHQQMGAVLLGLLLFLSFLYVKL